MRRILVVDDDQALREAYALLLSVSGYEVSTAFDGQDALRQYKKESPELVLLDMMMPNLDGVGFLKALDIATRPTTTKIIIFSNLSTSEKVSEAMSLGAAKHIIKSKLTPKELVSEIENMFSISE